MANDQQVKDLNEQLETMGKFKIDELITRSKWGEINFEKGRGDFDRIFGLAAHLKTLPIRLLSDNVIQTISSEAKQTTAILQQIDQFNLSGGNPVSVRNQYLDQLHSVADRFFNVAAQWVPYLAYQRGDVERNIAALTSSVSEAEVMVAEEKKKIAANGKEIEEIIIKAREASAKAGAAVFTRDFENQAKDFEKDSTFWLKISAGMASLTIVFAFFLWLLAEKGLDSGEIVQKVSTKLVVLAVMLTATIWCGRNYKALKHLAIINRHRALSIQTLQAFSAAASDNQAKDAVLLEATRAVFGNVPTGYIDGAGTDGDLKIIEVARSILPKPDRTN